MTEQMNITLATVVAQTEEQVSTSVDGETVLMSVETGKYFKLDSIGGRIWALMEKPVSVAALCNQLIQEYEVEPATCETDVLQLLPRLLKTNLLRVSNNG